MGNAVVTGISSGRNSSSLLLQRSRSILLSSSHHIFADAPSSYVASTSWLCSRQVLSHFSSSTAGRRSCSTIKDGGSHGKRGGSQDPAVGLTTSEEAVPMIKMKYEEVMEQAPLDKVIEKIFALAVALMTREQVPSVTEKVIEKNMAEVKRTVKALTGKLGVAEVRLNKLENANEIPNKAMKKVARGIGDLQKRFDEMNRNLNELIFAGDAPSETEDEEFYREFVDHGKTVRREEAN